MLFVVLCKKDRKKEKTVEIKEFQAAEYDKEFT